MHTTLCYRVQGELRMCLHQAIASPLRIPETPRAIRQHLRNGELTHREASRLRVTWLMQPETNSWN